MDPFAESISVISFLESVYGYKARVVIQQDLQSHIRAMFQPPNIITLFNPIETTPYHEYGHLLYYKLRRKIRFTVDSETFAQRFSTMWLNLKRTGFVCQRCGSQKFIPWHKEPRADLQDINLYCLNCGTAYELNEKEKHKLILHYNP